MLWAGGEMERIVVGTSDGAPHAASDNLSRSSIPLNQDGTLIAVIEMSQTSWLVAGIVPGVERHPAKKLAVDESALLNLLNRWRVEAEKAGRKIERIAVAASHGKTIPSLALS